MAVMAEDEKRPPSVGGTSHNDIPSSDDRPASASPGQPPPDPALDYPIGFHLAFIIAALMLGIFLASLDMTIVATAIPAITTTFSTLSHVHWYSAAFFLTNGGFQSSWGKAYRYFPLKPTFLATIFVFELGSLICAVAPNSTTFIVGRAFNGLGAAGIGTGAYTIIAFVTEPSKRAMYTGFVGMSFGMACVLGPLVGGVFADHVNWRWCFWINLPVGGLAAVIVVFLFHAPTTAKPVEATWREKVLQMDFGGVGLVMGGIVMFMLALQYGGQTESWGSGVVIGLLAGFGVLAVVFVTWERWQGERAIIVPRIFGKRAIWVSCGFAGTFVGSYYLVIYSLPIYFQSVGGASPTMSGLYNLPLIIATTISMIASGTLISKTGQSVPLQIIGAVIGVVATGLIYTLDTNTGIGKWIGFQVLGGVGWGIAFQIPIIMAQANAAPEDVSSATAMVLFFQCIGPTFLVTVAQSAFVNKLVLTLHATSPDIDTQKVITTGATSIRSSFPADQVVSIVSAYMLGIKIAFAIAITAAGAGLVIGLWNIKGERLSEDKAKEAHVAV